MVDAARPNSKETEHIHVDRSYVEEVARRRSIAANLDWLRENLAPVQVIYSDLDGTMMGPMGCFFRDFDRGLTLRPAKALVAAHARNIDIMLVSGRHRKQLRETARLLGCFNYVAELGTEIVYNLGQKVVMNLGEFTFSGTENDGCNDDEADENGPAGVYEAILATGIVDLLFSSFPGLIEFHAPWSHERDCTPLLRGNVELSEVQALLDSNGYGQFEVVDNGVIPRKSPTLCVAETRAYHVVPKGVSKEQAVRRDREIRSIPRNATVAVGDAEADLAFHRSTGAFFIVRNGLDHNPHLASVIDSSDNIFVTQDRVGEGWAEVVETMLSLSGC